MNQILETKLKTKKYINLLKIQILMSVLGIFNVFIFLNTNETNNLNNDTISKTLSLNTQIKSIYNTQDINNSNIFGRIEIPKIGLDYIVFNEFNEDLLKISPCKFYGVNLNEIR